MQNWLVGEIVETKSGLWEITYIGLTTYVLRNNAGRIHILFYDEMFAYCTKVKL
jgi:hypothetical protein